MSANKQSPIVLTVSEWNPSAIKYMAPKVNAAKGKSINIISKQTNRSLHIATPLMMTWGIADFVNEEGESDGKFSISLNFPNDEYANAATNEFLQKFKDLENQILDDAVKNAEVWWGETLSREVAKHTLFPILKYSKNKDTKKIDLSKPPSLRAKVPCYDGKWNIEIYDTRGNLLFPGENPHHTPMDFVPKLSNVACVLQCGGIWIGGKGWGVTWKLIQCVVKPREVVSVYGKCHIQLSPEERDTLDTQPLVDEVVADEMIAKDEVYTHKAPVTKVSITPAAVKAPEYLATLAPDSDDEAEPVKAPEPEAVPEVEEEAPVAAAPVAKVVKKIVKKKAT